MSLRFARILTRAAIARPGALSTSHRISRLQAISSAPRPPHDDSFTESSSSTQDAPRTPIKWLALAGGATFAALGGYYCYTPKEEEEPPRPRKLKTKKPPAETTPQNLITLQQAQVTDNWDRPGVWIWGDNSGKVADPYASGHEIAVKGPKRLAFFDDQVLRDVKLARNAGVAVTGKGDVVQWGVGYSKDARPTTTLTNKKIIKVELSGDRVVALSDSGAVYTLPISRADQESGEKPVEPASSSWGGLWSSPVGSTVAYRTVTPSNLGMRERVVDISSGREHCLMLTSNGRVFAAASSTLSFPSRGQLGIPGLSWMRRPMDVPFDAPHQVTHLKNHHIVAIATGENHSVALDKQGQIWAWGDNTFGQLGYENDMAYAVSDAPRQVDVSCLYLNTGLVPKVTSIAAGGSSTYFTADSTTQDKDKRQAVAEVWACGQGVHGQLGTGKWVHVCGTPARIMALSALTEFDERARRLVPIRLSAMSVGATHAGAVLANETRRGSDSKWGADVMVWGGNEHFQLGTGKRANSNKPVYIAPLGCVSALGGAQADGDARLQLAPRGVVKVDGRKVSTEQRIVCGDNLTAIYSAT